MLHPVSGDGGRHRSIPGGGRAWFQAPVEKTCQEFCWRGKGKAIHHAGFVLFSFGHSFTLLELNVCLSVTLSAGLMTLDHFLPSWESGVTGLLKMAQGSWFQQCRASGGELQWVWFINLSFTFKWYFSLLFFVYFFLYFLRDLSLFFFIGLFTHYKEKK